MKRVFTIGETIWDIIIKNKEPFTAKAGGACVNTAISLGRIGLPTYLIGEYGLDEVGHSIDEFLKKNNVNTECVYRYHDGKTPIALAFLNELNEATYEFYYMPPKQRLNLEFPAVTKDDIVLFGSLFSLNPDVRKELITFLKHARNQKAIIIYDPNFRKQHLHQLKELMPMIEENLSYANIVRASNIDCSFVFGTNTADESFEKIKDKNINLLYTHAPVAVQFRSLTQKVDIPLETINPISTIGAGDNFNAGVIYSLINENIGLKELSKISAETWEGIMKTAVRFANHVCMRYDNYVSREFASDYQKD